MKTVAASEMVVAAAAAAAREEQLQEKTEHQEQIIKLQAQLILEQQQVQHTATHCNHGKTLKRTATHCNTLQYTAKHCYTLHHTAAHCNSYWNNIRDKPCAAVCCSVWQCVAVCCSVQLILEQHQRQVMCCSVLQCLAVCCSVLQLATHIGTTSETSHPGGKPADVKALM